MARAWFVSTGTVYKGLVVSTIDTTPVEDGRVQFNTLPNGRIDDTDAVFLKNIEAGYAYESGFKPPVLVYRAEQIKPEDIARHVDKPPLFCMHGFLSPVAAYLWMCNDAVKTKELKHHSLIPVLWPSLPESPGGINLLESYNEVQDEGAVGAAKAFANLSTVLNQFPSKSVMTHSMGNRVLRLAAQNMADAGKGFAFDNIFMVGADVDNDIFDAGNDNGSNIRSMLTKDVDGKPKGKVYVIHNSSDLALLASSKFKGNKKRLGLDGYTVDADNVLSDVQNKDATASGWIFPKSDHFYPFKDGVLNFYDEVRIKG